MTPMEVVETNFEGLIVIEPQYFQDERGGFYESWRLKDYKKIGIKEDFLQDNVSVSKKNIIRGLHFQKNQGQLVTVVYGKVFDVAVDIRPDSKTYKKYFSIVLDANEPKQLYMPFGFAHGFCVLSDITILHYKCTKYYNSEEEGGIIWNDPEIGIQWPISNPILSKKDNSFKAMGEKR